MVWGHRNDVDGFARGLEAVDAGLAGHTRSSLGPDDRLSITPTTGSIPPRSAPTTAASTSRCCSIRVRRARRPRSTRALRRHRRDRLRPLHGRRGRPLAGAPVDRLRPARGWRRYTPAQAPSVRLRPRYPRPSRARRGARGGRMACTTRLGPPPPGRSSSVRVWQRPFPPSPRTAGGSPSGDLLSRGSPLARRARRRAPRPPPAGEHRPGCRSPLLRGRAPWLRGLRPQRDTVAGPDAGSLGSVGNRPQQRGRCRRARPDRRRPVLVREIVDLQQRAPRRSPLPLPAATPCSSSICRTGVVGADRLRVGVHAAVPGPHYETAAELEALRGTGGRLREHVAGRRSCAPPKRRAGGRGVRRDRQRRSSIARGGPRGAGSAGERFGATVARLAELLAPDAGALATRVSRPPAAILIDMTAVALTHRSPDGHHDPSERRFRRSGGGGGRLSALPRGPDRLRRFAQPQRSGVRVPARREPAHPEPAPDRPEQDPAAHHRRHGRPRAHRRPGQAVSHRPDVEVVVFDHHVDENPRAARLRQG